MKRFLLYILLMFSSMPAFSAVDTSCNDLEIEDKLSLSNCVQQHKEINLGYRLGSKFILKENFDIAAGLFSPIVDIDTSDYPDNTKKNLVLTEAIKYILWLAAYFALGIGGYFYIKGLFSQANSGQVWSMKSLYILVWLLGGGFVLVTNFFTVGQVLAASGLIILMIFISAVDSLLSAIFGSGDEKTVKNEMLVESHFVAEQIVESMNEMFINDIRNRKRIITATSVTANTFGQELTKLDYVQCFAKNNVSESGVTGNLLIPKSVLNSAYCARKLGGFDNYAMGYVEDKIMIPNTEVVLTAIQSMEPRIRDYANKVERNNCAIAYQSLKDRDLKLFSDCMDLADSGDLKVDGNNIIQPITETPVSDDSLIALKKSLSNDLSAKIYDAAIAQADTVKKGTESGANQPGVFKYLGPSTEHRKQYRSEALKITGAISVNTEVSVSRGLLTSLITPSREKKELEELGYNNVYGVQDYAEILSKTDSRVSLFKTVNAVSGGKSSAFGFNYEDCFNTKNCATTSPNILGVVSDAAYSVIAPTFIVYLGTTIWEGVAKTEKAKLVNTNKQIAQTEMPAKKVKDAAFIVMLTIIIFYLAFNYELYGKQFLRVIDWLLMSIVASFTMLFVVFAFVLDIIIRKKIDVEYFSLLRRAGLFDILFRPVILGIWLVALLVVMYINSAINSILIRIHLEGYISFYGSTGVVADIVTLIIFSGFYAVLMLMTAHKTIQAVDNELQEESESLFNGLSNSMDAANSVFEKLKGIQRAT